MIRRWLDRWAVKRLMGRLFELDEWGAMKDGALKSGDQLVIEAFLWRVYGDPDLADFVEQWVDVHAVAREDPSIEEVTP